MCDRLGLVGDMPRRRDASFRMDDTESVQRKDDVEGNTSEYGDLLYCGGILPLPYKARFWSTVLATVFPALIGIANYYVVSFRGTVLFPWDLGSIGTAISVADNYKFEFPYEMAILISAFILMYQIACKCGVKIFAKKIWLRVLLTVMSLSMGVGYAFYAQSDDIVSRFRLYPYMFTPNSVYSRDGMMVSLLFSLKYLAVDKPEGYDADLVNGVAEKYADDGGDGTSAEEKTKPNIIVIMNEAYSDLSVLRDFETNVNPMPFTSKLTENTVKGDLYVSVVGGNTANSEFEFLTGSSMAFLPTGSIPYQQFIKGEMPSFVSHLNDLGYSSSAMHPYYASGWDRNKVYSYFGFDKMFFKNDFNNPETIRQYISDAATYDKIIELYENKGDSPMFVFDVTMQNHSGYKGEVQNNFAPLVTVTDGKVSTGLSEYLSLVRISDLAFGDLVEYFKEADEPTVILMFGDHQPGRRRGALALYIGRTDVPAGIFRGSVQALYRSVLPLGEFRYRGKRRRDDKRKLSFDSPVRGRGDRAYPSDEIPFRALRKVSGA